MSKVYNTMISDQYCLSWSAVDGVREFVTNALDSDNPFEWDYSSNTLVLTTKNFTLDAKYLLMGVSENRGKEESVGRHGEGLVVSMGVLLREGHEVIIYNGSKQWIPKFEHSEDFDANFLAIHEYQDTFKSSDDFTIAIHDINQDMFDQIQDRCLYMQSEESVGKVIATDNGRILLERCCNIYVGGIWVSETELEYSYDFNPSKLKLNRDRQSVEGWELSTATANIWNIANDAEEVARMLEADSEDVKGFEYPWNLEKGLDTEISSMVESIYVDKYRGQKLVNTSSSADQAKKLGYNNVCVTGTSAFNSIASGTPSYKESVVRVDIESPVEMLEGCLDYLRADLVPSDMRQLEAVLGEFKARGVKWE